MASAVLAKRNEPASCTTAQRRGGGAKFMGKNPFSNPKLSKKRQFQAVVSQPLLDVDESPALMQPAVSDDASSVNRKPSGGGFNSSGYVTFSLSSYSNKELIELKNRLSSELEQIRRLKNQIDGSDLAIRSNPNLQSKKSIKKLTGNKRPFPVSSAMKRDDIRSMKNCAQILTKLMKHKHGYIFNAPVDVSGLQLHDYYDIIKRPMDLGTVKTRLGKNLYDSPLDFAADVRLTFDNAMRYNPKGHEVYVLAEQLLSRFEELFRPIKDKLGDEDFEREQEDMKEVQASSWDHRHSRAVSGGGEIDRVRSDQENVSRVELPSGTTQFQNQNLQSSSDLPVRTRSPVRAPQVKPVKQPKPKAKDPNKREMTLEEKHKLGIGLQSLPQEKMEQVVQIIRKRNGDLRQDGDEIELDIETVDTETLWELDRFVTNYKKMVSKLKRQALLGINSNVASNPAPTDGSNNVKSRMDVDENERMEARAETKKPRKGEAGDEDVDIGDEMPMSSFPPVEIEKDNGHASSRSSSSSSSSDDSSSSSDSDSGSSSGSDSEDAHS